MTPTAIPNFTWGAPTYTPASIVHLDQRLERSAVTVGNSITRDRGRIVVIKNALPAQGSFAFTTTGAGYNGFTLTGSTASSGNQNSQTLVTGTYTVKEATQLGWTLTGIGGSTDAEHAVQLHRVGQWRQHRRRQPGDRRPPRSPCRRATR